MKRIVKNTISGALGGCLGRILEALGGVLEACGAVLEALGGVLEALESVLEAPDVVLEAMLGQNGVLKLCKVTFLAFLKLPEKHEF